MACGWEYGGSGSRGVGDDFKWGSQRRPDGKSAVCVDLSKMRGLSM